MTYTVYTFSVPGEILPFYVGKGLPDRPFQHFQPAYLSGVTHFYKKLRKLLAAGITPLIHTVASGLTEKQAFDLEITLIKMYGRQDNGTGCLTNHTDGGDGKSGLACSDETKQKMRDAQAKIPQGNPVESTKGGVVQKTYPSLKSVEKDGYSPRSVSRVLQGHQETYRGLGWRYTNGQR